MSTTLGEGFLTYLRENGYTHCFFLAGGNVMHLLNSARSIFHMVPFVHEVSAVIAAEYFNHVHPTGAKAFVLVTAGPGLTNTVTGLAGAWLESREVLVVGGQVKSADLSPLSLRQLGIQEIDGPRMVDGITKLSFRVVDEFTALEFARELEKLCGRPGPIFVEWTLDAQAKPFEGFASHVGPIGGRSTSAPMATQQELNEIERLILTAERPVLLVGGGLDRNWFKSNIRRFEALGIPILFTWNAADYMPWDNPLNFGRPNTWGQLSANLILQQSDLVLAIGARLGLQQTGFAWESFAPLAKVVQVDIDQEELGKNRPTLTLKIWSDAQQFTEAFLDRLRPVGWSSWVHFCQQVLAKSPTAIDQSSHNPDYVQPQELLSLICELAPANALITPASSGSGYTAAMQTLRIRSSQRLVSNKGLASMGYGTAGAIGMALANPGCTTICIEGDGGFAQNIQELGTIAVNRLNVIVFVLANDGYASIRMTQRNYFGGNWVGCDQETGVGLPELEHLAATYGISYRLMKASNLEQQLASMFDDGGPMIIEVPVDPDQTYLPKISSYVSKDGSMTSNPLHLMDPPIPGEIEREILRYLRGRDK